MFDNLLNLTVNSTVNWRPKPYLTVIFLKTKYFVKPWISFFVVVFNLREWKHGVKYIQFFSCNIIDDQSAETNLLAIEFVVVILQVFKFVHIRSLNVFAQPLTTTIIIWHIHETLQCILMKNFTFRTENFSWQRFFNTNSY